jgi:hypothetical protein
MRSAVIASSLLGLTVLAGCPDRSISKVNPLQGRVEYKDIPFLQNRDVDILFVIDDSPSMLDKQTNLKNNFPNFINVLNTIQGGLPNIHLGVITSDMGSKGADDAAPGPGIGGSGQGSCNGTGKGGVLQTFGTPLVTGSFISDILPTGSMTRTTNYTGTLAAAFSAIASAGANGCGFEQHMEAAKQALIPTNTANSGFLRSSAFLAIIIVGDEDDCSMAHSSLIDTSASATATLGALASFRCTRFGVTCDQGGQDPGAMNVVGPKASCHSNESGTYLTKVADYITFFKGLKSDPQMVLVADIGGPPTPVSTELRPLMANGTPIPALAHSCTYVDTGGGTEVADPTVRVNELLAGFPGRSTYSTICQSDLSGGLTLIAQLLKSVIGSPCIDGTLAMPYDCSVSDITKEGQPNQQETVLPECNSGKTNVPCWAVEVDPMCATASMLTLKIERGGTTPSNDTHTVSYCVTEAM